MFLSMATGDVSKGVMGIYGTHLGPKSPKHQLYNQRMDIINNKSRYSCQEKHLILFVTGDCEATEYTAGFVMYGVKTL